MAAMQWWGSGGGSAGAGDSSSGGGGRARVAMQSAVVDAVGAVVGGSGAGGRHGSHRSHGHMGVSPGGISGSPPLLGIFFSFSFFLSAGMEGETQPHPRDESIEQVQRRGAMSWNSNGRLV